MSDSKEIEDRVRLRAGKGEFFEQLLLLSKNASADVHEDFIRQLSSVAVNLRRVFEKENLIRKVSYQSNEFWASARGKRVAFIDGGIARVDLPSSAPLGIRVGSYTVAPGDDSPARESFSVEFALVDELYSMDAKTYEDVFDDLQKLTDAARIVAETSVAFRMAKERNDLHAVFLHGPLVNPVAPYGTPGFPAFSADIARKFLADPTKVFEEDDDRHFMRVYRELLDGISKLDVPVLGVVERSMTRTAGLVRACLELLESQNRLSTDAKNDFIDKLEEYRLTDPAIFSVVLSTGEYLVPQPINRQLPENKWPNNWIRDIRRYKKAFTSYLKSSDVSEPIRLEIVEGQKIDTFSIEMMMYTARLLPNYGFPVGLDIVDKFAKVPAWMSRGIQNQHAVILMKHALKSGNQATIDYAKKIITARGRDWLFRPKA